MFVVSFRQLCSELRIVRVHAVLTWNLCGVARVSELRELRSGLLLGSNGGDRVFELRGRVVSLDHGRDDIEELLAVRCRQLPAVFGLSFM